MRAEDFWQANGLCVCWFVAVAQTVSADKFLASPTDVPLISMLMQPDQFIRAELREVNGVGSASALRRDAIDTTIRTIPVGVRIRMSRASIIPVRYIDRAIWSSG